VPEVAVLVVLAGKHHLSLATVSLKLKLTGTFCITPATVEVHNCPRNLWEKTIDMTHELTATKSVPAYDY
jgi:hypothetical protein